MIKGNIIINLDNRFYVVHYMEEMLRIININEFDIKILNKFYLKEIMIWYLVDFILFYFILKFKNRYFIIKNIIK